MLAAGAGDIAMSGVAVTPDRATGTLFSTPYLDETLAFVMRDQLRDRFRTWDDIRQLGAVRVGVPDIPLVPSRRSLRARRSCSSSLCGSRTSS